ncbi:MAG: uncharacterized protein A8A55_0183 [Amphiamblys sp. WSBS2006]|nr:MAG: uncharacterized protein A8A55_0183 [Amphiamblys sp. WSBS2006]
MDPDKNTVSKISHEIDFEILAKREEMLRIKEELRKAKQLKRKLEEMSQTKDFVLVSEKEVEEGNTPRLPKEPKEQSKKTKKEHPSPTNTKRAEEKEAAEKKSGGSEITITSTTTYSRTSPQKYKWTLNIKDEKKIKRVSFTEIDESSPERRKTVERAPLTFTGDTPHPEIFAEVKLQTASVTLHHEPLFRYSAHKTQLTQTVKINLDLAQKEERTIRVFPYCKHCGTFYTATHPAHAQEEDCKHAQTRVDTKSSPLDLPSPARPETRNASCIEKVPYFFLPPDQQDEEVLAVNNVLSLFTTQKQCPSTSSQILLEATLLFVKELALSTVRRVCLKERVPREECRAFVPTHVLKFLCLCIANPEQKKSFTGHKFDFLTNSFLE